MTYQYFNGFRLVTPYLDDVCFGVRKTWNGLQLIEVLKKHFSIPPLRSLTVIQVGRVLINGGVVKNPSFTVKAGDIVKVLIHRHEPEVLDRPIQLVHVDQQLLVVNKPPSVPIHPVGRFKRNSLTEILKEDYPSLVNKDEAVHILHRIDRVVSGLVLIARNKVVARRIASMMSSSHIHKEYIARVKGVFPLGPVQVDRPISKVQEKPPLYSVDFLKGKSATTVFRRLWIVKSGTGRGEESIISCFPVTGRTHQIRVHLQSLGHPIIDDIKYGGHLPPSDAMDLPSPVDYPLISWCSECKSGQRDVSDVAKEDLLSYSISLHSLKYSSVHPDWVWSFQTPPPTWATQSSSKN